MKSSVLWGVAAVFFVALVPSVFAVGKEFMTADALLALQEFKGQTVIKKGNPAHGRKLYAMYCTVCHGMSGDGKGQLAALLDPRPRNHTDGKGTRPGDGMNDRTDQQLFNAITQGGKGIKKSVNMPSWGHIISEESRWDLVAYLRSVAVPPYVPK